MRHAGVHPFVAFDSRHRCRERHRSMPPQAPPSAGAATRRFLFHRPLARHRRHLPPPPISPALASASAPLSAFERSSLASPSKAARKRARAALGAARAAEGRDPTADLSAALAEAQGPEAEAEG
uniref:Uncharacterized protein n=1 Tax=Haptolina brevifila TaxID=156173 RepID=A0A7S2JBQ0_9EUKA|mmetsp:Transcript_79174/g.157419  ORF Transcript_79174/g.157419 Transcript_79174/m.157419 type:complete len:124 (+) Transcript_79174:448-819(+)